MRCLVLVGDRYCPWGKRLERGRFQVSWARPQKQALDYRAWRLIVEGIDLRTVRRLKRYRHGERDRPLTAPSAGRCPRNRPGRSRSSARRRPTAWPGAWPPSAPSSSAASAGATPGPARMVAIRLLGICPGRGRGSAQLYCTGRARSMHPPCAAREDFATSRYRCRFAKWAFVRPIRPVLGARGRTEDRKPLNLAASSVDLSEHQRSKRYRRLSTERRIDALRTVPNLYPRAIARAGQRGNRLKSSRKSGGPGRIRTCDQRIMSLQVRL